MNTSLLVHNFIYTTSGLLALCIGLFILLKDTKNRSYVLFFIISLSYSLYIFFYILTVNVIDTQLSSVFAFLMIIAASTPVFNTHLAFVTFNIEKKHRFGLSVIYTTLLLMYIFFALNPMRVRLLSKPKLYFSNFFVPGPYYWLYTSFFFIVVFYFFFVLLLQYKKSTTTEKNRMKYFFVAFGWAYALSTPIFLTILNIKTIDVTLTAFMSLYIVPLAYGVYQYDLKNIKIFTKNTFVYGFLILICGTALVVINILHGYLLSTFSDLPIWFIPLISSLIIVSLSLVIWNQMHQVEILKYEFLNNISHKFRTPLTRIRWLTEDLRDSDDKDEKKKIADQIQFANMKLFELTDTVINTSKDNDLFLYHFTVITVGELLRDIHKAQMDEISQKKIDFEIQIPNPNLHIWADKNRLQFALQIIIENAVRYTPEGGWISFSVTEEEREVILICKDNGIGIAEGDIPHVFSKFYRSTEARKLDTEGMGLGLYMASNILEKHKGRITVESEGEHRGSIFKIILPIQ